MLAEALPQKPPPSGTAAVARPVAAPHLYADDVLLAPRALPPRTVGPGIVGDLVAAGSSEARARLVRGMLQAIGFDWLSYGTVASQRGQVWPLSFYKSYANPEWAQCYFSRRHYEVDARPSGAPTSSLPLLWDLTQLEVASRMDGEPDGRRQRFLDDMRTCGVRSGMLLRLASHSQSSEHTVISLLSSRPGRSWMADSVAGQGLVLGLSVHDYLSRYAGPPPMARPAGAYPTGMSTVQRQILQSLLEGRSDKEIAHRLHLSEHTVDYHMRQLRRRFSARNRVQLVNAATQSQAQPNDSGYAPLAA
jgi:DNA-binding CsgD family transcriptional regulator